MNDPQQLAREAEIAIGDCHDEAKLEQLRVAYLGQRGAIAELLRQLPQLPPEQRRDFGRAVNTAKTAIDASRSILPGPGQSAASPPHHEIHRGRMAPAAGYRSDILCPS